SKLKCLCVRLLLADHLDGACNSLCYIQTIMIPRKLIDAEYEMFRDTVRRFISEHITPHHAQWEKDGRTPRSLWHEAGKAGLLCCNVPEEYGGMGGDFLHSAILIEEMARAGATGPTFYLHSDIVAPYFVE